MEDKKFDLNSIIGFLLIGLILFWMVYMNQEEVEEASPNEATQTEQVEKQETDSLPSSAADLGSDSSNEVANDSIANLLAQQKLGSFALSELLSKEFEEDFTYIENEFLMLKVSHYGGQIVEAKLKQHDNYLGDPILIAKEGNSKFNIELKTRDGRTLQTKDLYFVPDLKLEGDKQVLTMRLKAEEDKYLEYRYVIHPDDHMLDFGLRSQGLNTILSGESEALLTWQIKSLRHAKSISYENQHSEIIFQYDGGKDDYTNQRERTEETGEKVDWVAYRQHFFSAILLTDSPFKSGKFISENLVQDKQVDTVYTKKYTSEIQLQLKGGEFAEQMNFYYGPTDIKILSTYDRGLDKVVPLGWGIFGWINKYVLIPFFGFLLKFIPSYGLAIVVMTITVRLILSPVTYKSYLSQAKMKVLRPEITQINEKYKDNAMKKQQETMKLYSKTGVSPLSGCIPALLQIPIFYALFRFFPSAFDLRQKGFLWADDLSSYDVIFEWDAYIPLISWAYGNHVSLFPILASIAIFGYMQMTTGQNMQQMQQPGMPNMKVIMYIMPFGMLIFFNNYASGLSLYYFISNLITIGIMLVIKKVIIDEDKILAKIEANKKKPKKKKGRFARKMQEIMEQAEEQKKLREKEQKKKK